MHSIIVSAVLVLPMLIGAAAAQEATGPAPAAAPPAGERQDPAGQPAIRLELNKLEPAQSACRVYFVVENQTEDEVAELHTDVYLFDRQETVLRGMVLQFACIRPKRTKVVPFELADLGCDAIGRVLLNDVVLCKRPDGSPLQGCGERLAISSRLDVNFSY